MAFKLNRPFSLGKYVKLRVNKKSVGLQVGGKYLKGTINTKGQITGSVGGAGTGMYLQKTKNLKNTAKCEAITKTGKRCSRNSSQLSGFCSQHKNFNTVNNQVETNGLKKIQMSSDIDEILSNNIFDLVPNNVEVARIANLFHSTNISLERLHTSNEIIEFQKNILNYYNFVLQDLINLIKNQKLSNLNKSSKNETEYLALVSGELLTRIINSSLAVSKCISPIKFPPEHKREIFVSSFPFEYSVLDYVDLNITISEQDFLKAVEYILNNFNNWNEKHNFKEEMLNDNIENELKIFSGLGSIMIPNSITGMFDLSSDALTYFKGFDVEQFIAIHTRCFTDSLEEIKKTNSYKLMLDVFEKYNYQLDTLIVENIGEDKNTNSFGTFLTKNVEFT